MKKQFVTLAVATLLAGTAFAQAKKESPRRYGIVAGKIATGEAYGVVLPKAMLSSRMKGKIVWAPMV